MSRQRRRLRRAGHLGLLVAALALGACTPPTAAAQRIEAERMQVAEGAGRVVRDAGASGGRALLLTGRRPARARVRVRVRSRLVVKVRAARRCASAPRLVAAVDGRRMLGRRIAGLRWAARGARRPVRPGWRTIALRLANPHRSRGCRRALRIDSVTLHPRPSGVGGPPPATDPGRGRPPGIWTPGPRTTWQWQLTTPVDQSVEAQMFDIDLFDNPASVVDSLHRRGRRVVCYMSAGSFEDWRPDAGAFPKSVLGRPLDGWPGERWLDIRRLDVIGPILERRLDLCREKGFDAVEADNVDGYANASGFPLTARDQLRFNRFVAAAAHARGLSIGLKNDLEQAAELEPDFDWAINEQCFQYDECDRLQPFVRAGKAVFVVEYELRSDAFCRRAQAAGFMAMRKRLDLDAWREPCW